MGLTGLGVACLRAVIGTQGGSKYSAISPTPSGFIAVILARAQLFTENTLYPMVLVLDERHPLMRMLCVEIKADEHAVAAREAA